MELRPFPGAAAVLLPLVATGGLLGEEVGLVEVWVFISWRGEGKWIKKKHKSAKDNDQKTNGTEWFHKKTFWFTYNLDLILGVFVIVANLEMQLHPWDLTSDFAHILLEYLKPDLFSLGQSMTGPISLLWEKGCDKTRKLLQSCSDGCWGVNSSTRTGQHKEQKAALQAFLYPCLALARV